MKTTIILKDQIYYFGKLTEFPQSLIDQYSLKPDEKKTLVCHANLLISRKAANFAYSVLGKFKIPIEELKFDLSSMDSNENLRELVRYFPHIPEVKQIVLRKSRVLTKDDLAYAIRNYPDIRDQLIGIYVNKLRVRYDTLEGLANIIELIAKNEILDPRIIQDAINASIYLSLDDKELDMHTVLRIFESLSFGWNKVYEMINIYNELVCKNMLFMHPSDLSHALKIYVYMNSLKRIPYHAFLKISSISKSLRERRFDVNNLIHITKSLFQLRLNIPDESMSYITSQLIQSEDDFNLDQLINIIELTCIIQARRAILPKYTYKIISQLQKDSLNLLAYSELYTITEEYNILKDLQPVLKEKIMRSLPTANIQELIGTMLICLFKDCRDILPLVESNLISLLDTDIPIEAYGKLLNIMGKLEYENAKFSTNLVSKLSDKMFSLSDNQFDSIIVFALHFFSNKPSNTELIKRSMRRIKENHLGVEKTSVKPINKDTTDWYKENDHYIVIKNDFLSRLGIRGQATILTSIFLAKARDQELFEIIQHYIKKIARHHFFEIKIKQRISLIKGAALRENLDREILTELITTWNKYPIANLEVLDRWKTVKDFSYVKAYLRNAKMTGIPEIELNIE